MKKLVWLFPALLLMLPACTGKHQSQQNDAPADSTGVADSVPADTLEELIADTPMPKAADELFDDFIFNFAASKKVQLSRIHFPLEVLKGEERELVQRSGWTTDHFFMQQGYYTLIFDNEKQMELCNDTAVNRVTIEKIFLDKKLIRQYDFGRVNGLWVMNRVRLIDLEDSPNASFLNFYHNFSTDSLFQVESLDEPVATIMPDPDDDFTMIDGEFYPEQWEEFRPPVLPAEMIYNIIYGQTYEESTQKVFVIRGISNGLETEMTFRRKDGKWKLVKIVN